MHTHFGNERWNQAAAFALRYEVFVSEQGIALKDEFDKFDSVSCNYYVVYEGDLVIATARYQMIDEQTIQPDRICVKIGYRKKGIGRKLLYEIEKRAITRGCTQSILSAEKNALSFYEKAGYQVNSGVYYEDGILCVEMKKCFE